MTPQAPIKGINARGITRSYGQIQALNGVDLTVDPGEIVALLGPNGAGKSTLLRILATLVLPDTGTVQVGEADAITQPLEARRRLGVVMGNERSLYWRLTGHANLTFFGALHGLTRTQSRQVADSTLATVGLSDAAHRRSAAIHPACVPASLWPGR